jgi:hypothetical protein
MLVFGGGSNGQAIDSDVWILNASSFPQLLWNRATTTNLTFSPKQRMGHSALFNPNTQEMYMFGGWGPSATGDNNMYVLDTKSMNWRSFDPAYGVRRPTTNSSAFSSSTMSSATTTSSEMSTSVSSSNEQSTSTAVITVNSGVCHKVYHVLNISSY